MARDGKGEGGEARNTSKAKSFTPSQYNGEASPMMGLVGLVEKIPVHQEDRHVSRPGPNTLNSRTMHAQSGCVPAKCTSGRRHLAEECLRFRKNDDKQYMQQNAQ
mmetsp:Transcript_46104/g.82331  ORF Transcript_46104/g.82331 Transcript_46104/m.82331 type:complete len:105 (-) Transcript_46104:562-876(-)